MSVGATALACMHEVFTFAAGMRSRRSVTLDRGALAFVVQAAYLELAGVGPLLEELLDALILLTLSLQLSLREFRHRL